MNRLRELAIEVLDDPHGITHEAWTILYEMVEKDDQHREFAEMVKGVEGRVFLPEGHGIEL